MREIKFRAWNTKEKSMEMPSSWGGEIVLGDYIEGMFYRNDVLMQYTGLKDKNGVQIYEGDILRVTVNNGFDYEPFTTAVQWYGDKGYPAFDFEYNPIDESNGLSMSSNYWQLKVVGNIYENPELLDAA